MLFDLAQCILHFFIVAGRAIPRMCILETEQKSRKLDGDIDVVELGRTISNVC
jgi:hypothetical protein